MNNVLEIFLALLPAGIANLLPALVTNIPFFEKPIDGGKGIFGDNKTWRGIIFGVLAAILISAVLGQKQWLQIGFMLGLGALLGDLAGSFLKRRFDIAPGESLPIIDQVDWVVGALIFSYYYFFWSKFEVAIAIVMFGILHVFVRLIGYSFGVVKDKV